MHTEERDGEGQEIGAVAAALTSRRFDAVPVNTASSVTVTRLYTAPL